MSQHNITGLKAEVGPHTSQDVKDAITHYGMPGAPFYLFAKSDGSTFSLDQIWSTSTMLDNLGKLI